jgi:hypothetical protein
VIDIFVLLLVRFLGLVEVVTVVELLESCSALFR